MENTYNSFSDFVMFIIYLTLLVMAYNAVILMARIDYLACLRCACRIGGALRVGQVISSIYNKLQSAFMAGLLLLRPALMTGPYLLAAAPMIILPPLTAVLTIMSFTCNALSYPLVWACRTEWSVPTCSLPDIIGALQVLRKKPQTEHLEPSPCRRDDDDDPPSDAAAVKLPSDAAAVAPAPLPLPVAPVFKCPPPRKQTEEIEISNADEEGPCPSRHKEEDPRSACSSIGSIVVSTEMTINRGEPVNEPFQLPYFMMEKFKRTNNMVDQQGMDSIGPRHDQTMRSVRRRVQSMSDMQTETPVKQRVQSMTDMQTEPPGYIEKPVSCVFSLASRSLHI